MFPPVCISVAGQVVIIIINLTTSGLPLPQCVQGKWLDRAENNEPIVRFYQLKPAEVRSCFTSIMGAGEAGDFPQDTVSSSLNTGLPPPVRAGGNSASWEQENIQMGWLAGWLAMCWLLAEIGNYFISATCGLLVKRSSFFFWKILKQTPYGDNNGTQHGQESGVKWCGACHVSVLPSSPLLLQSFIFIMLTADSRIRE